MRIARFLLLSAALHLAGLGSPSSATAAGPAAQTRMVASYGDLLDPLEIVRDGRSLAAARQDANAAAVLQPFLAPFSRLLPVMLEMAGGAAADGFRDLAGRYPAGSAQPGWAAILREGRFLVTTDGAGRARVYLPGKDPRAAWDRWYGLLRLPLTTLLPASGTPLSVEAYCYGNDYRAAELSLTTAPYRLQATSFPSRRRPLDLDALKSFFDRGLSPEGGRLDPGRGLLLYGRPGVTPTPSGGRLTLADFAVAWRAVSFAGDNAAFTSLDPHPDPTRVRVNFGGLLEDTRLGQVVLEADKRFKTITAGVDPDTFADRRESIRQAVPGFLGADEREFLDPPPPGWVGTRMWFYPESIRVETDPAQEVARIITPRFRADAERQLLDFSSMEEFARNRKKMISPAIRAAIDDLNRRYPLYEKAFPEFRDLTAAARLMGLAAWIHRSPASADYDFESLLGLPLPAFTTQREREKLITVSTAAFAGTAPPTAAAIAARVEVRVLRDFSSRKVGDIYPGPGEYREAWPGTPASPWEQARETPVGRIIASEGDLRKAVNAAAARLAPPPPPEARELARALEADRVELARLRGEIKDMGPIYNQELVDRHNTLVELHRKVEERRSRTARKMGGASFGSSLVTEISGGVNLDPGNITIARQARGMSPALREMVQSGDWVSSEAFSRLAPPRPSPSSPLRPAAPSSRPPVRARAPLPVAAPPTASLLPLPSGAPRQVESANLPSAGRRPGEVVGKMEQPGRIVFTLSSD